MGDTNPTSLTCREDADRVLADPGTPLPPKEATQYRALAARLNYLRQSMDHSLVYERCSRLSRALEQAIQQRGHALDGALMEIAALCAAQAQR